MPGLHPEHVRKLHELIHAKQLLNAIQFYQQATGVSLAEARAAIEEMARNELVKPPDSVRDYDNPVLESKIKSLLSKNKKIDAIKIYREEYGIGLNEARSAVERIEASMLSGGSSRGIQNVPYESAIGADPFAEDGNTNRRVLVLVGFVAALAVCGAAVFILLLGG
jgi:ribosomal protein L7/L12